MHPTDEQAITACEEAIKRVNDWANETIVKLKTQEDLKIQAINNDNKAEKTIVEQESDKEAIIRIAELEKAKRRAVMAVAEIMKTANSFVMTILDIASRLEPLKRNQLTPKEQTLLDAYLQTLDKVLTSYDTMNLNAVELNQDNWSITHIFSQLLSCYKQPAFHDSLNALLELTKQREAIEQLYKTHKQPVLPTDITAGVPTFDMLNGNIFQYIVRPLMPINEALKHISDMDPDELELTSLQDNVKMIVQTCKSIEERLPEQAPSPSWLASVATRLASTVQQFHPGIKTYRTTQPAEYPSSETSERYITSVRESIRLLLEKLKHHPEKPTIEHPITKEQLDELLLSNVALDGQTITLSTLPSILKEGITTLEENLKNIDNDDVKKLIEADIRTLNHQLEQIELSTHQQTPTSIERVINTLEQITIQLFDMLETSLTMILKLPSVVAIPIAIITISTLFPTTGAIIGVTLAFIVGLTLLTNIGHSIGGPSDHFKLINDWFKSSSKESHLLLTEQNLINQDGPKTHQGQIKNELNSLIAEDHSVSDSDEVTNPILPRDQPF